MFRQATWTGERSITIWRKCSLRWWFATSTWWSRLLLSRCTKDLKRSAGSPLGTSGYKRIDRLRLVYTYDASVSISTSISLSYVREPGRRKHKRKKKERSLCLCLCLCLRRPGSHVAYAFACACVVCACKPTFSKRNATSNPDVKCLSGQPRWPRRWTPTDIAFFWRPITLFSLLNRLGLVIAPAISRVFPQLFKSSQMLRAGCGEQGRGEMR